jgi:biopolymer transport protein ExbD
MNTESGGGRGRGPSSQDFDLNLAPIIDCFVVLITFMLASAAFLSIGILDAGIAAAGATTSKSQPPPINITVELQSSHLALIEVTGKMRKKIPVAAKGDTWNYEDLTAQLASIKAKYPSVTAATLSAQNTVQYKDVVQSMEIVRKTLPAVLLGGF